MNRPVVDLLHTEWDALGELGDELSTDDWDRRSDCPGWTVRDNLSHVIGIERQLLGDPAPRFEGEMPSWVKNPIGELNEAWIQERRNRPGTEVLVEFRETVARRREQMDGMSEDDWRQEMPGPTGIVPYEEFMEIRVMDTWVHDQDIRRAVGRPGNVTGPVADHSLARFVPAMGFVVGKKAGATEGVSVVFDLTGPQGRTIAVNVVDGRARVAADVSAEPTVTIHMDTETWWCLALGRWNGTAALDDDDVRIDIEGDEALGRRVVENLAFMI